MTAGKWIGGFLGFITGGPLGLLAGFTLGWIFDKGLDAVNTPQNSGTYSFNESKESRTDSNYYNLREEEGQRNSFLFSLLVLASYIIRADGKIMHSEMEFTRSFLRNNFGPIAEKQGEEILLKLFEKQKEIGQVQFQTVIYSACQQMAENMNYAQRLQLVNFLILIGKSDGSFVQSEIKAVRLIAAALGLSQADIESMLNLGEPEANIEADYKILGITPSATNDEIKTAYRQMALKHHPDRVATLGEDVRKAAEKKFQEINAAKERIYKIRGIK
jgi:DnaJ like chaperone protein